MANRGNHRQLLDDILHEVIENWYQRVKSNYVTEEESRQLGVEPEVKFFHDSGSHRIKFARTEELDVTYGLAVLEEDDRLFVDSSVNNKSGGFDFQTFVVRLKRHYWRSRTEKPWTQPEFDRFTYSDLMPFEPNIGDSVVLETRKEKADIIRLRFPINPRHENLLMEHQEILRDLVENYCLNPLKRIFAESYRESR